MSIHMTLELPDQRAAQAVLQALELYRAQLRSSIDRSRRRLSAFEKRYGVTTAHFLTKMAAEDLSGGDLEYVEWAGEAKLLEGLKEEIRELENVRHQLS